MGLPPPHQIPFKDILAEKKVIILHFWATSCPACIPELKELERIARTHMNAPIRFIALSVNDPRSGVLRNYFKRSHYAHLKPYHNPNSMRPPIKGLPTTLFFNKNGELIGRIEGAAKWHSDEMKRLLERLIAEEPRLMETAPSFFTPLKEIFAKWFS